VLASASAWAVRPSAASARLVPTPAFFLPAWSRVGDHRCSPSQEGCRGIPSSTTWHESLPFHGRRAWPAAGRNSTARVGPTSNTKCLKSPHATVVPQGFQYSRFRRSQHRVPAISLLSRVRLTAPSRGRPASGPPLTSNVRPHSVRRAIPAPGNLQRRTSCVRHHRSRNALVCRGHLGNMGCGRTG
jgi:hypothetical protein